MRHAIAAASPLHHAPGSPRKASRPKQRSDVFATRSSEGRTRLRIYPPKPRPGLVAAGRRTGGGKGKAALVDATEENPVRLRVYPRQASRHRLENPTMWEIGRAHV